jgi:ABC-type polysaccharide/polyol phosphate transport system ATPase subunit
MTDIAIRASHLSKCYHIYNNPHDRLKQFVIPRLQRMTGRQSKQYFHDFLALDNVSFEIKKGETVGIIGRNGSGKSTLLQIICGTLSPTEGNVEVNGRIAALLELGAGFNPEFTGRENLYMNATILGLSNKEIEACFDDIVAFADIGEFIDQPVKTYSSGMYVRLAFSVSVHTKPDILVVDEALSVGDFVFQNRCMEKIQALKQAGTSILFVSHDLGTVQIICDRAIWMEHGSIEAFGTVNAVCQDYYAAGLKKKLPVTQHLTVPAKEAYIPQQLTGMAHFSRLRTLDHHGQPCESFNVGDAMSIEFELQADSALDESIFTISIYRADGDWSIGQTSAEKQVFWPAVTAGETLTGQLLLSPVSLTPADYKICFSAFSTDSKICYAMTELTVGFSVRSSYQTWGKFIHPCEWIRND